MTTENKNQELNNENNDKVEELNAQVQSEPNVEDSKNESLNQEQSVSSESNNKVAAESDNSSDESQDAPFNIGDVVSGNVYSIEDKFVKVQLDDSDYEGIVPISQLTNKRIEKPSEVVQLDDKVTGNVIKVENEDGRHNVIFSIRKHEEQHAYDQLLNQKENDETIEGTVTSVVRAGLVVDVGVRGFVPASLVSDTFVEDLEQFDGQTLKLKIEEIDQENNRVILNRKRIIESEKSQNRKDKLNSIEVGSIIEGEVVRTTSFGAFINIGDVDGLAHISELSYSRVENVEDAVKIGESVRVKVLDVNPEEERISLSIKQAQDSPFTKFVQNTNVNDVLKGKVKRLVDFGAFVEVASGVEGLVHVSEISHDHVNVPKDVLEEGQEVDVKVLSINEDSEKLSLSIKGTQSAPARKEQQKQQNTTTYSSSSDEDDDSPTLGDVFGDRLKNLDI